MVSDMVDGGAVLAERESDWWAGSWASISVILQTALLRLVQQLYIPEEAYILGLH